MLLVEKRLDLCTMCGCWVTHTQIQVGGPCSGRRVPVRGRKRRAVHDKFVQGLRELEA